MSREKLLQLLIDQSAVTEELQLQLAQKEDVIGKMEKDTVQDTPTADQLIAELKRAQHSRKYRAALRAAMLTLVLIAVIALAVSFWLFSVMQVQGGSMAPTLQNGDIVVALKGSDVRKGDLAAFYLNDKLLIKRVIAMSGDEVSILPDGTVSVNGIILSESYASNQALGNCDITFPYTVPQECMFVLGDDRSASADSRHDAIGCVAPEQLVGRVFLRIWPFEQMTLFNDVP